MLHMQREELISSLTHLIFGIFAIFLTIIAIIKGVSLRSPYHIVSYSIFGISMILLYFSSGIYHFLPSKTDIKKLFKKLDHIMIFFLIAGTYTPFCLITLKGVLGWSIFGIIWSVALAGLFFKIFCLNAPRILYTAIYVVMGWIIIFAIKPIYNNLSLNGFMWLAAGGLFYTVGAVIYALKRPNPVPGMFGFHEIWHIFVILGTSAHYISIYFYT
ncbi:hemolysin III family protein [Deferribacterales bacterium Es71-Z0220]|uniref:PAQR family membrane homeostasis protein TrhA n=1 Tax=Deferrivibrio essentukiensis TaxID=2880922 RepID=UPI001F60A365|nr:hemolysin III family protein [Deferrivibrio essentukiensis]MCB4205017.1 hemolysin III family protein [Deferrivibrio essentukiensis]